MIVRSLEEKLIKSLKVMPVTAIIGSRQIGKTTLALEIAEKAFQKKATYIDLELDTDLSKLDDAESYLRRFENQLLIIDEVQRKKEIFRILRGLVDIRKRKGEKAGQFLLLALHRKI